MTRNEHTHSEAAAAGRPQQAAAGGRRLFRRLQRLEQQCANANSAGYSPTQHRRDSLRRQLYARP